MYATVMHGEPLADGALVATREMPGPDMIPNMLAVSDVLDVALTADDLREIEEGHAALAIQGARSTESLLERSDVGAWPGTSSAGGYGMSPLPADRRP